MQSGKRAGGSAVYLNDIATELATNCRSAAACDECWLRADVASGALRHAAARAVATAAATLTAAAGGRGLVFEGRAWNDNTVDSIRYGGEPASRRFPSSPLVHQEHLGIIGVEKCVRPSIVALQPLVPWSCRPICQEPRRLALTLLCLQYLQIFLSLSLSLSLSLPRSTFLTRRAAKAHCTYVLHQTFVESIERLEAAAAVSPPSSGQGLSVGRDTGAVLRQLAALFALEQLERSGGVTALLEDGYLNGEGVGALRGAGSAGGMGLCMGRLNIHSPLQRMVDCVLRRPHPSLGPKSPGIQPSSPCLTGPPSWPDTPTALTPRPLIGCAPPSPLPAGVPDMCPSVHLFP